MAIVYSLNTLTERIKRHIANGFPNASFTASDNEVQLYITQALAASLVGQVYALAKVEGNIAVPEGFLTTFSLPALAQDSVTKEWFTTLPQVPLSLPLGYSIDNVYFANSAYGKGTQVHLIKAKRVSLRREMPLQNGVNAWIEGNKIILQAHDGTPLFDQTLYARMATTRSADANAIMSAPDDVIEGVFNNVTSKLIQRIQMPKDIIKDDIGAGNKSS